MWNTAYACIDIYLLAMHAASLGGNKYCSFLLSFCFLSSFSASIVITLTTFTFYIHNCLWIWLAHFFSALVGIPHQSILLLTTSVLTDAFVMMKKNQPRECYCCWLLANILTHTHISNTFRLRYVYDSSAASNDVRDQNYLYLWLET